MKSINTLKYISYLWWGRFNIQRCQTCLHWVRDSGKNSSAGLCRIWQDNSNIYMEEQRTTESQDAPEAYSVSHKSTFTIRAGCWCKDRKERLMERNTKSKEGMKCRTVLQTSRKEKNHSMCDSGQLLTHTDKKNCILHYHVKSINYRLFKELKARSIAINILKDGIIGILGLLKQDTKALTIKHLRSRSLCLWNGIIKK